MNVIKIAPVTYILVINGDYVNAENVSVTMTSLTFDMCRGHVEILDA